MPDGWSSSVEALYIHVPFCAQKCAYCAFFSEASSGELVNRYVSALVRELAIVAADLRPKTIFFGGGTPSILNLRQWEKIFRAMQKHNLLGAQEFTVESNPATVSLDKAKLLRDCGVNRISMGVQSLDEALLDRLGRVHSRGMVFKSFDVLRRAGFDNLNIDLMFAIPGQTLEVWRQTLREALALGSEHLSSYEVIYEEDTPLFEQLKSRKFDVDEDLACAMYEELVECAATAEFRQYEVANFARDRRVSNDKLQMRNGRWVEDSGFHSPFGIDQSEFPAFACQHNINYWRGGSFYGLGPSATSYVRGVRTKNWSNTQLYCEQLEKGNRAIESREELSPLARAGETAAFGLRMVSGWPFEEFQRVTNYDLRKEWLEEMNQLTTHGWGRQDDQRFQLTSRGLRFADCAAELFLR